MEIAKKVIAIGLVIVAVLVAADYLLADALYEDSAEDISEILRWLIGLAVLVALVINVLRKRALGGDGSTGESSMEVNAPLVATIVLALWVFSGLIGDKPFDGGFITTPLVVLISAATGAHLWQEASTSGE